MVRTGKLIHDGSILSTAMIPWRELRAAAPEDGAAAIDLTAGGYALSEVTPAMGRIDLQAAFGNSFAVLLLAFYSAPYGGQDPAEDDTFGLDLIGWRGQSGDINPPSLIATVGAAAGIVGTMPVLGVTDAFWADSLSLTFTDWIGTSTVYDSAADRMAMVVIDAIGIQYIWPYYHGALGAQAGEAPSVVCVGSVY